MTTQPTYNHIPALRFPEFLNDGEWEVMRLEEISVNESSTLSLSKLDLCDFGYPVYGADGLIGLIREYKQEEEYIAIIKDGSGYGKLFLYPSKTSVLSTLTYVKSKDKQKYDLRWLYYMMQGISFNSYVKGSGIPHVYFSDFGKHIVFVPPLAEQHQIAESLSALDEMLSATNDKLEQLKAYKKGLMQKLFPALGKTLPEYRFKEFEKDGEWEVKKLGDVITEVKDTTNDSVTIPLYSLTIDEGITAKTERYERGFLVTKKDNVFKVVSPNDFVSNPMNLRFGAVGYNQNAFSVCVSGYYDVFRFKEDGTSVFWNNYLKSDLLLHKYDEIAIGSLIEKRRVYFSNLQNLKVFVPSVCEQRKIASCLSTMDDQINAYAEKVALLGQYKKGLMQRMFPQNKMN